MRALFAQFKSIQIPEKKALEEDAPHVCSFVYVGFLRAGVRRGTGKEWGKVVVNPVLTSRDIKLFMLDSAIPCQ